MSMEYPQQQGRILEFWKEVEMPRGYFNKTGLPVRLNKPAWNKGKLWSEEIKNKVRNSLKKIKRSEEFKRKVSKGLKKAYSLGLIKPNLLGKHHSEGTKEKMRLAQQKVIAEGRHNFYIDGRTSNKEYIYYRDKRIKQKYECLKKDGGLLTLKTIQLIYEDNIKQYGTLTCYLCFKSIEFGKDQLEHKLPLCRGGTNEYNNLAIACKRCNCRKGEKTEEEFRNYILEGS